MSDPSSARLALLREHDPVVCPNGTWRTIKSPNTWANSAPHVIHVALSTVCGFLFLAMVLLIRRSLRQYPPKSRRHLESLGKWSFLAIFFLGFDLLIPGRVTDCTLGCSSWASACNSISCICANLTTEGYVYLLLLMAFNCKIFLDEINSIAAGRMQALRKTAGGWAQWCEYMMRAGVLLAVITGLVPSPASNCDIMEPESLGGNSCLEDQMAYLHTFGIGCGVALLLLGSGLRMFVPRCSDATKIAGIWLVPGSKYMQAECTQEHATAGQPWVKIDGWWQFLLPGNPLADGNSCSWRASKDCWLLAILGECWPGSWNWKRSKNMQTEYTHAVGEPVCALTSLQPCSAPRA